MPVYVLNKHGHPLMPCSPAKARHLLKEGKAIVKKRTPFTIQLRYGSSGYMTALLKWLLLAPFRLAFAILKLMWRIFSFPIRWLFGLTKPSSGQEYEHHVAKYLKRHGYRRVEVTQASGDYGVDIIARKGFKKYAIQCKYYSNPVGVHAVQEVVAGKIHYDCNASMIVTNSTFTRQAITLAAENNVLLLANVG